MPCTAILAPTSYHLINVDVNLVSHSIYNSSIRSYLLYYIFASTVFHESGCIHSRKKEGKKRKETNKYTRKERKKDRKKRKEQINETKRKKVQSMMKANKTKKERHIKKRKTNKERKSREKERYSKKEKKENERERSTSRRGGAARGSEEELRSQKYPWR